MGELIQRGLPCDRCGSSDAYEQYTDGGHCFSCGKGDRKTTTTATQPKDKKLKKLIPQGDINYRELVARKIRKEVAVNYKYGYSTYRGKPVQVAQYFDKHGDVVAQKLRYPDKSMEWLGDSSKVQLFGQNIFSSGEANRFDSTVVITEGEIDALSVSQAVGGNFAVVSLEMGAQSAKKSVAKHLRWLGKFDKVLLCFDNDKAGIEAIEETASLFDTVYVVKLPLKDANEMVLNGRSKELTNAVYNAEKYMPECVKTVDELLDGLTDPVEIGLSWPYPSLTDATYGIRLHEMYGFGAGTGVGKSENFKEIIAHFADVHKQKVSPIFLEERARLTLKQLVGKLINKRLHVPKQAVELTDEVKKQAEDKAKQIKDLVYFYDKFGSTRWSDVKHHIRYMYHNFGVQWFFLDHLTALVAAEDDEKKALERIMEEMASLVTNLPISIFYISHLTTPEGKTHEEGGRVKIRDFKGSRAIGFWTHFMFGLERDQQAEGDQKNRAVLRGLKDRFTGESVGVQIPLVYDIDTGRYSEHVPEKENPFTNDNMEEEEESEY